MVPENLDLQEFAHRLPRSRSNNFVVVNEKEEIAGILTFLDYYDKLFNGKIDNYMLVKDIMTPDVVTVSIEDTLDTALEKITVEDYSILPVVAADNPLKMLGDLNFWVDSRSYNIIECMHMFWLMATCDLIIGKAEYPVS